VSVAEVVAAGAACSESGEVAREESLYIRSLLTLFAYILGLF
jgi:hypothetical protein